MSDKPTHVCIWQGGRAMQDQYGDPMPTPKYMEEVTVLDAYTYLGVTMYKIKEYHPDEMGFRADMFRPIQHDFTNKLTAKLAKAGQKDYVEYNPEEFKIPVITEETLKQDF